MRTNIEPIGVIFGDTRVIARGEKRLRFQIRLAMDRICVDSIKKGSKNKHGDANGKDD